MDPTRFNSRVLKEPRGMIRIIQLVFAILAFSTTASFDTQTSFTISCYINAEQSSVQNSVQKQSTYAVEYPFDLRDTKLTYLSECLNSATKTTKFDMNFSSSAQFFVATGVLCFLYTIGSLVVYVMAAPLYETNPLFPVVDLIITAVFSLFWLSGASAWAATVSDLKYYTGPHHLIAQLPICSEQQPLNSTGKYDCLPESPGKWSTLYISLIFGFANLFLWSSSMWFVYKETSFHRKTLQPQPTGYPGISGQPPMPGQVPQMVPQMAPQMAPQMIQQQQQQQMQQQPQQYINEQQYGGGQNY